MFLKILYMLLSNLFYNLLIQFLAIFPCKIKLFILLFKESSGKNNIQRNVDINLNFQEIIYSQNLIIFCFLS